MSTENMTKNKPEKVQIFIDGAKYHATADELTGAQIRALADPPVADDRDLWLDIVDELDELIEEDRVVHLEAKMRFFSVPREINPGQPTIRYSRNRAGR
ncbi:multiubiquitin domain-containing protein [Mumia sp. DW29H23]|uniref:multiubiquitin domain-containing protein n=1 Tax=Mumia sp. DW29H23 TaxID=3421241 RepID=UPI003D684A61